MATCDSCHHVVREYRPAKATTRPEVTSPDQASELLRPHFDGADREMAFGLYLDTKHRLIAEPDLLSVGVLAATWMAPAPILRGALLANASAIIVSHVHPSGDPEPSADDEQVTRRLVRACETLGVGLLDHLVFGDDEWVSMARRGQL